MCNFCCKFAHFLCIMTRIVRNMASMSLLQIANYLIPLLVLPVVSRVLGASLFGSVGYAQNIVSYLTLLVNFGFEPWHLHSHA